MKLRNPDSFHQFGKLFHNEEKADVWFTKGDHKIPAHKLLLAASSNVFDRMFYGEFDPVDEVPFFESIESFTQFLQLFYLDEVDIKAENIQDVVKLVDKYNVKNCKKLCEQFLEHLATNENVCTYLDTALMIGLSTQSLESKISTETEVILKTDGFKKCSRDTLEKILSLSEMNCDEVLVFESAMDWASIECKRQGLDDDILNRKGVLGDSFYLIRFPIMKIKEFLDAIERYPTIMELDEYLDILQYISSKRPMTIAARFST